MKDVLTKLAQTPIPHEKIEEFNEMRLKREFPDRLKRQLELMRCTDRMVHRWADELIEMYQSSERSVLRTEGLRLLSKIIMGAFRRLDENGQLRDMPLRSPRELKGDLEFYITWCPSTMFAEAHPDIEVLLVGLAPAYAENKVGIPLVDYENLTSSACMECINFERCFMYSVLTERGKADFSSRLLGCQFQQADAHTIESRRVRVTGMHCHTAGEILRHALKKALLVRPSWGVPVRGQQVVAAATNALRETTLELSVTGVRNSQPDQAKIERDAGWLWLEAALIRPKATVLLGNDALTAYQICTGNKRKVGINPFDRSVAFGVVYKSYHPSYIMRRRGSTRRPDRMIEKIESDSFTRQSLMPGNDSHELGALAHLIDVLTSARKVAAQEEPLLEKIDGSSDILPVYLLGDNNTE
mgnify:CR=1 FL=1